MNIRQKLNSMGVEIPSVLLPRSGIDMQKWPVIACDQFTQDRGFWEKVKTFVGTEPSTLNLIFPEAYLSDGDAAARIQDIHSAMSRYLNEGVFGAPRQGFIYTERDTPYNKKRRGLIAAIDLEQYDWRPSSLPLIRSTEGTVPERLPPRMDIRRGAPLELPHVLLLIDDEADTLLPAIGEYAKKNAPVYNTPLMIEAGNVAGWFLDAADGSSAGGNKNGSASGEAFALIAQKLEELCRRSGKRYGDAAPPRPFLFAVGDGNHSLAAAKGIWEEYKANAAGKAVNELPECQNLPEHPCRYALVEIENIYDPAIQFEPIHRLILGAGFEEAVSVLLQLPDSSCRNAGSSSELVRLLLADELCAQPSAAVRFGVVSEGRYALIETSASGIATASLQPLLDSAVKDSKHLSIDYIHDEEELFRLTGGGSQAAGILLPPVQKSGLFETIARFGPLPRKSFSMGHSCEKRFYLECRRLF